MNSNITKESVQKLKELYQKLIPILRELCLMEEKIVTAASQDSPELLDHLVTDSQPALLSFRGIEKKREALNQELNLKGKKLSEILTLVPEDSRPDLEPLFQETETYLRRFKEAKDTAERIMQLRLNDINIRLDGIPAPKSFQDRRV